MITPHAPFRSDAVAEHYDALDTLYRELWGEHLHHGLWPEGRPGRAASPEAAARALAERVARAAGAAPGRRVVDVGCGYGGTSRVLARRGAHVTALTLSAAQAAYARAQPPLAGTPPETPAPSYRVRDWLENDLPTAHFDAAVAVESTTHMPERPRVFGEIARVLRPGGRLVLCVWMTAPAPSPVAARLLLEPICREGRLAGMGSAAENRAWIADAGLRVCRFEDWSARVARTWTVCIARAARRLARDPAARRVLRKAPERAFARALLRLRVAYAAGAMRYGYFEAENPLV
ncbi:MAG: methyltransferase domain-containing protein [Rubricoccaceae bacterium]